MTSNGENALEKLSFDVIDDMNERRMKMLTFEYSREQERESQTQTE